MSFVIVICIIPCIIYLSLFTYHLYRMKSLRSRLTSIILQTVIWSVLLWVAFSYLSFHPAEKVGIFSMLDTIYQKVISINKHINGWSSTNIDDLTHYKSAFQEIKWVLSSKACEQALRANKLSLSAIDEILQSLDVLTAKEFDSKKTAYITLFTSINEKIQSLCHKE